jgi:hypothetical protein
MAVPRFSHSARMKITLRQIKMPRVVRQNKLQMAQIIFRCPYTSMNVQHWLADDSTSHDGTYEPVKCPACTRLHFIHRSTGKLLGEE